MEYNKPSNKSRIITRGPRDSQLKSMGADLVNKLQDQLATVTAALYAREKEINQISSSGKIYTQEEFEKALYNQLQIELSKRNDSPFKPEELLKEVDTLKNRIRELEIGLNTKEDLIRLLVTNTDNKTISRQGLLAPEVERVVIDPTEDTNMTSHINISSHKEDQPPKEQFANSVSKLKNLIGKKI